MAITHDADSSSITNGFQASGYNPTWTHTPVGTPTLVVLCAQVWQDTAGTGSINTGASAPTYGGTAMSFAVAKTNTGQRAEIWYLASPPAGAQTVNVKITGATDAVKLSATTFLGTATTLALGNTAIGPAFGSNPSKAITTANANSVIVAAFAEFNTTAFTIGGGFTDIVNNSTVSTTFDSSYLIATTAGSYTWSATDADFNDDLAVVLAEFKVAAASGATATPAGQSIALAFGTAVAYDETALPTGQSMTLSAGVAVATGLPAGTAAPSGQGITLSVGTATATGLTPGLATPAGLSMALIAGTATATGNADGTAVPVGQHIALAFNGPIATAASGVFSETWTDLSNWNVSNYTVANYAGGGSTVTFSPAHVFIINGYLCLELTEPTASTSTGGEIQSKNKFGYGTYTWVMRMSSSAATPLGAGSNVGSGCISSSFTYWDSGGPYSGNGTDNGRYTEIDMVEIEGRAPTQLETTSWVNPTGGQGGSFGTIVTESGMDTAFHEYKLVWQPGREDFYFDGVLYATNELAAG